MFSLLGCVFVLGMGCKKRKKNHAQHELALLSQLPLNLTTNSVGFQQPLCIFSIFKRLHFLFYFLCKPCEEPFIILWSCALVWGRGTYVKLTKLFVPLTKVSIMLACSPVLNLICASSKLTLDLTQADFPISKVTMGRGDAGLCP